MNRFVEFIAKLQMTAFGAFVSQILWSIGSVSFTLVSCILLLDEGVKAESHHNFGIQLAGFLLAAWTGKSLANWGATHTIRTTAREYKEVAEAKARGKAAGSLTVKTEDQGKTEVNVNGGTTAPTPAPAPQLTTDDERGTE